MNRLDPTTEALRDVCQKLIAAYVPNELEYFDLVWDAFFRSLGISSIHELTEPIQFNVLRDPVRVLGAIGGGASTVATLVYVMPLVTAAAALCRQGQQPPPEHIVEEEIQKELDRLKIPEYACRAVLHLGVPLLVRLFAAPAEKVSRSRRATANALDQPAAFIYFKHTDSDEPESDEASTPEQLAKWQNRFAEFALFVDEIRRQIRIKGVGDEPLPFSGLRRMQRLMLWMIMTHVGRSIQYGEIQDAVLMTGGDMIKDPSVFQYRYALKPLLGAERLGRFVKRGTSGEYVVPATGFSYCWIRRCNDSRRSELLYQRKRERYADQA